MDPVLHLDTGREWRGGQRQVLLLVLGLRERGIGSLVGCPSDSPLARRLGEAGVPCLPFAPRGDLDVLAAARLGWTLRGEEVAIVHAHDPRAQALALLTRASGAVRSAPLIVTRRSAFGHGKGIASRVKYRYGVALYIAISDAVRRELVATGVAPERIRVVHSGIEFHDAVVDERRPVDWRLRLELPPDAFLIGSVGTISGEKGYADLVRAAARLPSRVHVVLVGGRAEAEHIRALARDLDIAARIHLPGRTDRPRDAMAGFDVYAQPSRSEGLGTSVLDALALGLPTVTSDAGGLAEVVEPEVSGLRVAAGDPEALASALERLLGDPELRARLGDGGRRRAESFSAEAMVEGTADVYRELAGAA